jgi:inosine-uridine nucleoside N-ribohydrolase
VIKLSIPTTMYGLDLFDRLKINEGAVEHFQTHDHPAIRLAGELLYRRRAHEVKRDYAGPLGDAGAMVMLTNPELFVTEPLPVYINLQGVGRGQTIVDRGAIPDDQLARDRRAWPRIGVALDLDVANGCGRINPGRNLVRGRPTGLVSNCRTDGGPKLTGRPN